MKIFLTFLIFSLSHEQVSARTYLFVAAHFPKIVEENEDQSLKGLGVELTKKIAKIHNLDIKIKVFPLKRAISMIEEGSADAIIGAYYSKKRAKFISYSNQFFYQDKITLYTLKQSKLDWNGDFSNLKKLRLGAIRGWSLGDKFNMHSTDYNIVYVNQLEQLFSMLYLKRIDFLIAHQRAVNNIMSTNDFNMKYRKIQKTISTNRGYFGFSKKRELEKLKSLFDKSYLELSKSDYISNLMRKYQLD